MTSNTLQDPFDILLNRKPLRTYENLRKNLNLSKSTISAANNSLYSVAEWVEDQNKYLQTKIRSSKISKPDRVTNVPKDCKNINSPNLLYNVRRSRRLKKRTSRLTSESENKENNRQAVPYITDKNEDGNEKNKSEIKEVFRDINSRLNIAINITGENTDTAKNYVNVHLKTEKLNIITRSRRKQCTKAAEQNENMKTNNLKVIRKNTNLETSQNVIYVDKPTNTSQEINMESASNILVNRNISDPFDSLKCAKSLRTYVSLSPKRKNISEVSFKKTADSKELRKDAMDVSFQYSTHHREIRRLRIKCVNNDNEKNHTKSNVRRKLIPEDTNIQQKNKEFNIFRHSERIMEKNRSQNKKSNIIKNSSIEIQLSRNHTPKMKNLKSTNSLTNIKDGDAHSSLINKKSLRRYASISSVEKSNLSSILHPVQTPKYSKQESIQSRIEHRKNQEVDNKTPSRRSLRQIEMNTLKSHLQMKKNKDLL